MATLNEIIKTLKINDKVLIIYGDSEEQFQGYIDSITESYLIIHEYVSDKYITLNLNRIREIKKS